MPAQRMVVIGASAGGVEALLEIVEALPPDFSAPELATAPDAKFVPAPSDGVLPEGFFSSTNLPTYLKKA